jgi:glycerate-2-kinase
VVDGETAARARERRIYPDEYLDNNDSYNFFSRLDALSGEKHRIVTGPTGTNVMDLQIIFIEG